MIDKKKLDDEPRMVLYKHSNRPDHDCINYFFLRFSQNANLVFHQKKKSEAIILNDYIPASPLDNFVTFASEVLFDREFQIAIMSEVYFYKRIHLRIPGRPEISNTEDEKAEASFLISSLTQKVLSSPNTTMLIADLINK